MKQDLDDPELLNLRKNQVYMQVKNQVHIYEIFNVKFYDSSKVDLIFNFRNCVLELSNLLMRFGKLNCKSVTLRLDELNYSYQEVVRVNSNKESSKDMYDSDDQLVEHKVARKSSGNKLEKFIETIQVCDHEKKYHTFLLTDFVKTSRGLFQLKYFKELSDGKMINPICIIAKKF